MNRNRSLEAMRGQRFDVVVIGGGITGAGVALDAASRGLSVALVEKGDFASGTSSKSSKVIHGGLRYLKNLQFGMTIESVRERELLMRMAPHLVRPLRILLPCRATLGYKGALSAYDVMASAPAGRRHKRIGEEEMRRIAPHLPKHGVDGAFQYFDAGADDCRLVMHVLKKAVELGAAVANYVEVAGFTRGAVEVRDTISNESFAIECDVAVNATGVWADEVRRRLDGNVPRLLRASKGIHLVLEAEKLNIDGAVTIPKTSSGHYLFIAPWQGRTIVGTTDTEYDGDLDHPTATDDDIATLLDALEEWFPSARVTESDILAVYAGLRPLAASSVDTASASREDFIERRGSLITVAGGKLTTFRRMAKRVVDMITNVPCVTDRLSLFASETPPPNLPPTIATHLHEAFGSEANNVGADGLLDPELPHTWAEIDYVIRNEMAMNVEDVLARRTRIALVARDHGRALEKEVAARLRL